MNIHIFIYFFTDKRNNIHILYYEEVFEGFLISNCTIFQMDKTIYASLFPPWNWGLVRLVSAFLDTYNTLTLFEFGFFKC